MACFLVPATEAVVATIIKHRVPDPSNQEHDDSPALDVAVGTKQADSTQTGTVPVSWKERLSWLTRMLWGGSGLLAIEHIWHGEVTFMPPFLTAMQSPDQTQVMLQEMATNGVGMAVLVTAVWGISVVAVDRIPAMRRLVQPNLAEA